jgi:tRNA pseudouridine-54 N-methylase
MNHILLDVKKCHTHTHTHSETREKEEIQKKDLCAYILLSHCFKRAFFIAQGNSPTTTVIFILGESERKKICAWKKSVVELAGMRLYVSIFERSLFVN